MKNKINFQLILSILFCLIPFIISAAFYEQLPEQVAIHFNFNGDPDNYAPRLFVAFGVPLLMFCLNLYNWFMLENDPKKANSSKALKRLSKWLIPLTAVIMQTALTSYAIGFTFDWSFYVLLLVGIVVVILGNYLPKCKQNYTVGIKLPWTLNDNDNWNKTHRISGYIWILGGFVLILNAFVKIEWLPGVVIAILVLTPVIFSFLLYKKKLN
ncbi:MAG: putative rane protein [Herbinix sp.]|jgi:uncharacterized membrane protein|nr:putative rane protein [Herbinix sp.]